MRGFMRTLPFSWAERFHLQGIRRKQRVEGLLQGFRLSRRRAGQRVSEHRRPGFAPPLQRPPLEACDVHRPQAVPAPHPPVLRLSCNGGSGPVENMRCSGEQRDFCFAGRPTAAPAGALPVA